MKENILYLNGSNTNDRIYKEVRNMCAPLENIKGKTAKEILNQYYTGEKFPLDLGILLKNIGMLSKDYDFAMAGKIEGGKVLGAVVSNEKNAVIFYDRYSSYNRQRFTIAHELAHCCLRTNTEETEPYRHIEFRMDKPSKDIIERNADIFAGQLLIPVDELEIAYKKFSKPYSSLLAQYFQVSVSVMEARLRYLGIPFFDRNGRLVYDE